MDFKSKTKNVTKQCIAGCIKDFLTYEQPRRQLLSHYYRGSQGVNKGMVVQGRPNNMLTANFAKYISDVHTGYFMGVAPTFSFESRRSGDKLLREIERTGLATVLYSAAHSMSVCGEGFALTYLGPKGARIVSLDPSSTFVITHGVENEVCAAVRIVSESAQTVEGELYTSGEVCDFVLEQGELSLSAATPLPFKRLAVTRFCNNTSATGDFEPVTALLDAYNLLLSGSMDDMQSVANAFLALYGMQGTTREDIEQANRSRVLSLSENGKAEFVVKNINSNAISLLKKTLVDDMLLITMTPNLNDEAFGNGSSGVALEYKLWGAEQARAAKERGFCGGVYHIIGQLLELLNLDEQGARCEVRFYKNLPQDLGKICDNVAKLDSIVSHRTKLELLPFISDVEKELVQIEKESI